MSTVGEFAKDAKKAGYSGKTRVADLASLVSNTACRDKIRDAYQRMNGELHKLVKWKREHGYCGKGLSCMNRSGESFACKDCRTLHHPRASVAYTTPYGKWRKEERNKAKKNTKPKSKKQAA
jgi:NADH pyrophosphatase NudC (nudix superfamily)